MNSRDNHENNEHDNHNFDNNNDDSKQHMPTTMMNNN